MKPFSSDQADKLRALVNASREPSEPATHAVLVLGSQNQIETGGISRSLAKSIHECSRRSLLIEADERVVERTIQPREQCGATLVDVLAGAEKLSSTLRTAAQGYAIASLGRLPATFQQGAEASWQRCWDQLTESEAGFEWLVFNVGDRHAAVVEHLVRHIDLAIVAATCEPSAVIDAYAAIKSLCRVESCMRFGVVLLHEEDDTRVEQVGLKLESSCAKFLGTGLEFCESVLVEEPLNAFQLGEDVFDLANAVVTTMERRTNAQAYIGKAA